MREIKRAYVTMRVIVATTRDVNDVLHNVLSINAVEKIDFLNSKDTI